MRRGPCRLPRTPRRAPGRPPSGQGRGIRWSAPPHRNVSDLSMRPPWNRCRRSASSRDGYSSCHLPTRDVCRTTLIRHLEDCFEALHEVCSVGDDANERAVPAQGLQDIGNTLDGGLVQRSEALVDEEAVQVNTRRQQVLDGQSECKRSEEGFPPGQRCDIARSRRAERVLHHHLVVLLEQQLEASLTQDAQVVVCRHQQLFEDAAADERHYALAAEVTCDLLVG